MQLPQSQCHMPNIKRFLADVEVLKGAEVCICTYSSHLGLIQGQSQVWMVEVAIDSSSLVRFTKEPLLASL